jgi:tripartite-type tricarboxylate transporter receptor subunit TctC
MKKILILLCLLCSTVQAKDIRLIVPYSPGGATDRLSRMLSSSLSTVDYNFIVDYRLGAAGSVAANHVAETNNETVIMITSNGFIGNPLINSSERYNVEKDFIFVNYLGAEPLLITVPSTSQIKDLRNLLRMSKTKVMPYGSAGIGSSGHFTCAVIADQNTNFIHIPYKGGSAALTDLLAGHISWMSESESVLGPYIKNKKITPVAVFYHKRLIQYPDVPTVKESGIDDRDFYRWHIMVANLDADPAVIAHLRERLRDPAIKTSINNLGIDVTPVKNSNNFLKTETIKLQKIIKDFNIAQ